MSNRQDPKKLVKLIELHSQETLAHLIDLQTKLISKEIEWNLKNLRMYSRVNERYERYNNARDVLRGVIADTHYRLLPKRIFFLVMTRMERSIMSNLKDEIEGLTDRLVRNPDAFSSENLAWLRRCRRIYSRKLVQQDLDMHSYRLRRRLYKGLLKDNGLKLTRRIDLRRVYGGAHVLTAIAFTSGAIKYIQNTLEKVHLFPPVKVIDLGK